MADDHHQRRPKAKGRMADGMDDGRGADLALHGGMRKRRKSSPPARQNERPSYSSHPLLPAKLPFSPSFMCRPNLRPNCRPFASIFGISAGAIFLLRSPSPLPLPASTEQKKSLFPSAFAPKLLDVFIHTSFFPSRLANKFHRSCSSAHPFAH
jgi:hypothetical protein